VDGVGERERRAHRNAAPRVQIGHRRRAHAARQRRHARELRHRVPFDPDVVARDQARVLRQGAGVEQSAHAGRSFHAACQSQVAVR
jgi:hypothetical protein